MSWWTAVLKVWRRDSWGSPSLFRGSVNQNYLYAYSKIFSLILSWSRMKFLRYQRKFFTYLQSLLTYSFLSQLHTCMRVVFFTYLNQYIISQQTKCRSKGDNSAISSNLEIKEICRNPVPYHFITKFCFENCGYF